MMRAISAALAAMMLLPATAFGQGETRYIYATVSYFSHGPGAKAMGGAVMLPSQVKQIHLQSMVAYPVPDLDCTAAADHESGVTVSCTGGSISCVIHAQSGPADGLGEAHDTSCLEGELALFLKPLLLPRQQ